MKNSGNIKYWSDECDRKVMAEKIAQGVNEVYDNLLNREGDIIAKNSGFQGNLEHKSFVLIGSEDFWGEGQWLRYWEKRIKAFGVEVESESFITNKGNSNEK